MSEQLRAHTDLTEDQFDGQHPQCRAQSPGISVSCPERYGEVNVHFLWICNSLNTRDITTLKVPICSPTSVIKTARLIVKVPHSRPRHSSTSKIPKDTYQHIPQHLSSVVTHQPRLLNAKNRKPPDRKRNSLLALRVRQGRVLVPGRGGARAPDHRERRESQSDSSKRPVYPPDLRIHLYLLSRPCGTRSGT
ncbi:rCG65849 [Rattus norvegicus]|uniref:LRRGT00022 n=2 Tax=Rattus norvegicus TaxID=10116 RepID=Q6TXH7_RAT|nr:LRRGT00022 [Rattus norvegicus]EDL77704.1 rCG65849 [Rattus norvegicus]|eukprot:NP_001171296.1 uncharacterized protein LOC100363289 [Rattus norvegicus]